MTSLAMLIKRNILIFIKDKSSVFFSFLSMLIIIGLNVIFLNKTNVDSLLKIIPAEREKVEFMVNSMVMAGIIVVNATTVTLGVAGVMVDDDENNKLKSFYISPVSRMNITFGYILSAFIIGCIFCFLTFFISEVYIFFSGGELLTFVNMIKVIFYIVVNVFSSSCFIFFITSVIHSARSFSTISVVIGTLVGFVGGLYVPIGQLPDFVQKIIKCCPIIYGTSLMKDVFVENPIISVFSNADVDVIDSYKEFMAISISLNNNVVSDIQKIMILLASGLFFTAISIMIIKNKKIKDR